jgi:hypothetical protein
MSFVNDIDPAVSRLCSTLGLGTGIKSIQFTFKAGDIALLKVQRILTQEEVKALADWFDTEDVELVEGETVYRLREKS